MARNVLRMWFYHRPGSVSVPILRDDYEHLLTQLKQLAMGDRSIPGYLVFKLSQDVALLVSVKSLAALQCLDDASAEVPTVDGAEVYLRDLPDPIPVRFHEHGPFEDLVQEMCETSCLEDPEGCVMMPDRDGNSIFFRPDDVHYILFDTHYLEGS